MKYDFVCGIDTGVNTGLAIWNCQNKAFELFGTYMIHQAFEIVKAYSKKGSILVRVEDARTIGGGKRSGYNAQGAGSIKRDGKAWQDFLEDYKIDFQMLAPNNTKVGIPYFEKATGIKSRTSEHCRDACMIVLNYNK
jgi:hypothetical protein